MNGSQNHELQVASGPSEVDDKIPIDFNEATISPCIFAT